MYKSIKKLGVTNQWPGWKNAYEVDVQFKDGEGTHRISLLKEETEMQIFMIEVLKEKLTDKEMKQFECLLEDYALMNYSRGSDSVFED